jgi:hypothetical protein
MYRSLRAQAFDFIAAGQIILLVPVIIGLLAFARLTRFRWLARYPVAVLGGAGVGALWGLTIRSRFLAPIGDTVTAVASAAWDLLSRVAFVVLFVLTVCRFLHSRRFSDMFFERKWRLYYLQRLVLYSFMVLVAYQQGPGISGFMRLVQTVIKLVIDSLFHI